MLCIIGSCTHIAAKVLIYLAPDCMYMSTYEPVSIIYVISILRLKW